MKPETLTKMRTLTLRANKDELNALQDAINMRRRQLNREQAAEALSTLKIGDTVRLKEIRPQQLNGAKATITGVRQTKFNIRLYGSYMRGNRMVKDLIVPASCLEPA